MTKRLASVILVSLVVGLMVLSAVNIAVPGSVPGKAAGTSTPAAISATTTSAPSFTTVVSGGSVVVSSSSSSSSASGGPTAAPLSTGATGAAQTPTTPPAASVGSSTIEQPRVGGTSYNPPTQTGTAANASCAPCGASSLWFTTTGRVSVGVGNLLILSITDHIQTGPNLVVANLTSGGVVSSWTRLGPNNWDQPSTGGNAADYSYVFYGLVTTASAGATVNVTTVGAGGSSGTGATSASAALVAFSSVNQVTPVDSSHFSVGHASFSNSFVTVSGFSETVYQAIATSSASFANGFRSGIVMVNGNDSTNTSTYTLRQVANSPGSTTTYQQFASQLNYGYWSVSLEGTTPTYATQFTQTTLPAAESWFVNLTGSTYCTLTCSTSGTGSPISINLPNDTYSFTVASGGKLYQPTPGSGSVMVAGASPSPRAISFAPPTVAISETGLLNVSATWYVNFTSGPAGFTLPPGGSALAGSSISFQLINGSYTYVSVSNDKAYHAHPATISLTVSASPSGNTVTFYPWYETVEFSETGITNESATFYVNVTSTVGGYTPSPASGSCVVSLSGCTIPITVTNGTWSYTAATNDKDYYLTQVTRTVKVVGNSATGNAAAFQAFTFSASFGETGLSNSSATWGITITAWPGGFFSTPPSRSASAGNPILINLVNGTYTFNAASGDTAYYLTQADGLTARMTVSSPSTSVTFHAFTYATTFSESGLASGTTWFVNFTAAPNGFTPSSSPSSATTLVVNLINGSYTYSVASANKIFYAHPAAGHSAHVVGATQEVSVTFTAYLFAATFTESATGGDSWFVNVTGTNCAYTVCSQSGSLSGSGSLTLNLPNGSYTYTVATGGLFYGPSASGVLQGHETITVAGGATIQPAGSSTQAITFTAKTQVATVSQTGISGGTEHWYLNATGPVGGVQCSLSTCTTSGTGASLTLTLFNGSYTNTVQSQGLYYAPNFGAGTITVNGGGATPSHASITFTAQTKVATVSQTGISGGTEHWYLNATGPAGGIQCSLSTCSTSGTGASLTLTLFNGSYTNTVQSQGLYYAPNFGAGTITVNGGGATPSHASVTFTEVAHTATFTESVTAWDSWYVNLTGPAGGLQCSLVTCAMSGTLSGSSSLAFSLVNGTYTYLVQAGGSFYGPSPATNSITVIGTGATIHPASAASQAITFTAYTTSVTFHTVSLPTWESYFVNLTAQNSTSLPSQHSLGGTNIVDHLFNGTYTYTVASGAHYYGPSLASSSAVVAYNTPVTKTVTFTAYTTSVTFATVSLPTWESYFVNLTAQNGTGLSSQSSIGGTDIVDHLFNGTYAFTVASGAFYYGPSAASGSAAVTYNTPLTSTITFSAYTRAETVTPSGLGSWTGYWYVNLTAANGTNPVGPTSALACSSNTVLCASPTTSITFNAFNGTTFVINSWQEYYGPGQATAIVSGITTTGTSNTFDVTFSAYVTSVTFTPSGVGSAESWTVNLTAQNRSLLSPIYVASGASGITVLLFNATLAHPYGYTVATGGLYYTPSPATGSISVTYGTPVANVLSSTTFTLQTYTSAFQELGLTGETWAVSLSPTGIQCSLSGVTCSATGPGFGNSEQNLTLVNGTYDYTLADVPGWHIFPAGGQYTGSYSVSGSNPSTISVTFTQVTYAVTFTESGLYVGVTWGVTVNGTLYFALAGSPVSTDLPNGTWTYEIADVAGWHQTTLPYTGGSGTVDAAPVNMSTLAFTQVKYLVTFAETGLTSGVRWQVTINGTPESVRAPNSITTMLPNGTFTYNISDVAGWHQTTLPYSGGVGNVTGAPVNEATILFVQVVYGITVTETGLTAGITWSVVLNGTLLSAEAPGSLHATLPNGTFRYTIGGVQGWHQSTLPYSGTGTIDGAPVNMTTIDFTQVVYSVEFSSTGLTGETWGVTVNGTHTTTTHTSIVFTVPNGTWTYQIDNVPGWHQTTLAYSGTGVMNGSAVNMTTIAWGQVLYTVTFHESGLPSGQWSVTLNGTRITEDVGTAISMSLPNGTYSWAISDYTGYHQTTLAYSGTGHVSGATVTQPTLVFTLVTYSVTFTQTGLGSGVSWSANLSGVVQNGTGPSITFSEPNGTYDFSVAATGYTSVPASGSLTVNGTAQSQAITFHSIVPVYTVTFTETGLPAHTTWTVTFNGTAQSATAPGSITFPGMPNGTYAFTVASVAGYGVTPASGSVSVSGSSVTETVIFTERPAGTYLVTFTETGLTTGSSWNVTTNGVTKAATISTIVFALPNGSYAYSIALAGDYYAVVGATGNYSVAGAPVSFSVTFAWTTTVTISQSGIPNGTTWEAQVTLNPTPSHVPGSMALTGLVGRSWFANSTTPTALFHLVNGSFSYTIKASGYQPATSSFNVTGTPVSVPTVTVSPNPSSSSALSWWVWAIIGVVIAAVVIAVVALLLRRGGSKGQGPQTSAPPSQPATPPQDGQSPGAGNPPARP